MMKKTSYIITIFVISGICLTGCRSAQYVPVESVRTEIEYRDRIQRDSIHVHDSIHVMEKGDTVFVGRWHVEYKDRHVHDTTYINKTDSVLVPYPVEKQLSRWEEVKLNIGGMAIGAILAICVAGILALYKKIRSKK